MTAYLASYAATAIVILVLDALWLGVIARPLYRQGIGHLMADRPDLVVAALFYAVYALGVVIFAVAPHEAAAYRRTLLAGVLFGLFAYATYDLTNLATLRDWPVGVALLDIGWGGVVSGAAALGGRWAMDRWA
jgi:uncharacterized membrane protein